MVCVMTLGAFSALKASFYIFVLETEKVQSEIDKVIGSNEPQVIHRKEMPYTDAVIHEIPRFGNILPANLSHATTQDVNFRGYLLPKSAGSGKGLDMWFEGKISVKDYPEAVSFTSLKGNLSAGFCQGIQVIPLLTSILYDKNHFVRADEFYPEHFLDSSGNFVRKEAFIPFSAVSQVQWQKPSSTTKETGSHEDRPKKGRPRVTSASEDKFIRVTSLRNGRLTAAQIRDQVSATQSSSSRHISTTTVKWRLCAARLHGKIAARKPLLRTGNKQKRLVWAKERMEWTLDQSKSVLRSDESKSDIFG
ncbi:unnamed protein product [Ranitomeya imitator]|uniref:Transposase Tc1-like domain-containing protein n=1 Tax=Ranitomeya imitator TaxID=111125 RepID=A0ABN9KUN4_9NEOB|nr:unnamed protein product [Ranitomeya imitator]